MNDEKTAATDAGVVPIDHAKGQSSRNGCVDGIAAFLKGLLARLRGQRVDGREGVFGECGICGEQHRLGEQNQGGQDFHTTDASRGIGHVESKQPTAKVVRL